MKPADRKIDREPQTEPLTEPPVGYGRPPIATRFQKGKSGNVKGRPRGSLNIATALMAALREKVVITEHGQRQTVTKLEAAVKQIVNQAAAGDLRALRQLTELAREAEQSTSRTDAPDQPLGEVDKKIVQGILRRFTIAEHP